MARMGKIEGRITCAGWDIALTDDSGGPTTITIPAGTYYHSSGDSTGRDLAAEFAVQAAAVMGQTWSCSVDASESGTGKYTISCTGSTCTVTFTDADAGTVMGFAGNLSGSTSYTSTGHARNLWLPDSGYQALCGYDGSTWQGVWEYDLNQLESPCGDVWSVAGSRRRVLEPVWPAVSANKAIVAEEDTADESFERFYLDALCGDQTWSTAGGPVRVHYDADVDTAYYSYHAAQPPTYKAAQFVEHWTGAWTVTLPRLVQLPTTTYTLGTLTPAAIAEITGRPTPHLMWLGSDASGATEIVLGTDNLTDSGTPTHLIDDATLGATVTSFDYLTTDAFVAADNTVADVGAESLTIMVIMRISQVSAPNIRNVVGKRSGTGSSLGWELLVSDYRGLRLVTDIGPTPKTVTVAVDHGTANAQVVVATFNYTAATQAIYTREGSDSTAITAGSLTNTSTFAIGSQRAPSAGFELGAVALWIGSDGEGFGETERLAVAEALGYE